MSTLSLHQLLEHLRQAIALNFPEPLWVRAEIAQVGVSREHHFLSLVQNGDDAEPVARVDAVIWDRQFRKLHRKFGLELKALLQEGLEVRFQVCVDFHELYGLKLMVEDVDPAHTFGQLAAQRLQTVETLKKEGLINLNRQLALPPVLQRLAVISSSTAAGYKDFIEQLQSNPYGYAFSCTFFQAAMQGQNVLPEVSAAFEEIQARADQFDAVVIIRGGGARLDLIAFDGLELSRKAAQLPLPLFTGIGHEIDQTVLDVVANQSLKTPTAVAAFLVQHNLNFENHLFELHAHMRNAMHWHLSLQQRTLERLQAQLNAAVSATVRNAEHALLLKAQSLKSAAGMRLHTAKAELQRMGDWLAAVDPGQVLKRGYSITYQNGQVLRSAKAVEPGDVIQTRLSDGTIISKTLEKE